MTRKSESLCVLQASRELKGDIIHSLITQGAGRECNYRALSVASRAILMMLLICTSLPSAPLTLVPEMQNTAPRRAVSAELNTKNSFTARRAHLSQYYQERGKLAKLASARADKKITFKEAYLSSLSLIYRDATWCAAIKSIHQKHIIQGIMMIDSELASDTKIWVAIYQRAWDESVRVWYTSFIRIACGMPLCFTCFHSFSISAHDKSCSSTTFPSYLQRSFSLLDNSHEKFWKWLMSVLILLHINH